MVFDSGRRAKRKPTGAVLISTVAGAALVAALAGWFAWAWMRNSQQHQADDYAAYVQSGPPCPQRTPQDLEVNGPHLRHTFEFGEMKLSYSFGGADCAWVKGQDGKQAVCKFDSPGSLGVQLKAASQILYAPSIGHSAVILRKGEQIACVMSPRLVVDPG